MDKYKGYLKRQEYELSSTILWSTNGYQNSTLCTILGKGRLSEKKNNEEERTAEENVWTLELHVIHLFWKTNPWLIERNVVYDR